VARGVEGVVAMVGAVEEAASVASEVAEAAKGGLEAIEVEVASDRTDFRVTCTPHSFVRTAQEDPRLYSRVYQFG